MKNNFLAGIIDALWYGKKIEPSFDKEQPRDRKGRWSKEQSKVIFYGQLRERIAQ